MRRTPATRNFKVNTGTVICSRDSARRRVTYTMPFTTDPATMRTLRSARLRREMRSVVSRANVMTVRGAARGNCSTGLLCVQ